MREGQQERCIGYPVLETRHGVINVRCSIIGQGWSHQEAQVTPTRMGELVDLHAATCPNRLSGVAVRG